MTGLVLMLKNLGEPVELWKSPINVPPKAKPRRSRPKWEPAATMMGEDSGRKSGQHQLSRLSEKEGGDEENKLSIKKRWMEEEE